MERSILLVDDEAIILHSVSCVLETAGYMVNTASSGEGAVSKFNNECIVITDLMMPGISGIEVLKEIKLKNPGTIVVVITGFGELNSAIEALKLGAVDYLLKPVKNEELLLRGEDWFKRIELQMRVKIYEDILPVCCVCKSVRDDQGKDHGKGSWMPMETYIKTKSKVDVSHTFCPKCHDEFMETSLKQVSEMNSGVSND